MVFFMNENKTETKTETAREKRVRMQLFCCHYARLGDLEAAARYAGFSPENAAATGAALLRKQSCKKLVASYRAALRQDTASLVKTGLERLAFGRVNDVIRLLLADEPLSPTEMARLDLFSVSSIKRDKSGGMEVHFFDRLKALSSLYEYNSDTDEKAAAHALLAALSGETAATEEATEDD